MKKRLLLGGIVLASMMALVGCGSSGDDVDPIVGTWKDDCFVEDANSTQVTVTFNADETYSYTEREYDGINCSGTPTDEGGASGTYLTGAIVNAADGEPATELDIHDTKYHENGVETDADTKYFFMYRIVDNKIFFSDESDENNGSSADNRAEEFDVNDTGLTRQ